jgi:CO dehydrogenase/acetyl-CoA synthase epsilon subunit
MAEFYTFDPSADIQRGFQKAGAGVADIFSHLVATQKRENEIADKMFQNIEALKKDVNIYGQKVITDKTNVLLKDASKVILEGGKLDYSQLGSIRQRVSDIADDKKKYELGAELRKEYMQLGFANKDNITSIEGLIKGITAPLMDPNIKNATDLQAAMQDAYDKSLNLDRIGVKSVMNILPEEQIKGYGTNGKGDLVNYEFKGLKGSSYDVNTGKVIGPDAQKIKDVAATMKAQMPNYFDDYRKRIGVNEDILSDNVIAKKLIDQIGVNQGQALNQTATSVKKEAEQLKALETENKFAPEEKKSRINLTKAQEWAIYNPQEKKGAVYNYGGGNRTKENVNSFLSITETGPKIVNGKASGNSSMEFTLSNPLAINMPGVRLQGGKGAQMPEMQVTSFKKQGGKYYVTGFPKGKQEAGGVSATLDEGTVNKKPIVVTLDQKGFDSMLNRMKGMAGDTQAENINTLQKMQLINTKAEAGRIGANKRIPMSNIEQAAQGQGIPILQMMIEAKGQGFTIYQD